jgi:glycosyltransferase involved in cell wall biosynthesis
MRRMIERENCCANPRHLRAPPWKIDTSRSAARRTRFKSDREIAVARIRACRLKLQGFLPTREEVVELFLVPFRAEAARSLAQGLGADVAVVDLDDVLMRRRSLLADPSHGVEDVVAAAATAELAYYVHVEQLARLRSRRVVVFGECLQEPAERRLLERAARCVWDDPRVQWLDRTPREGARRRLLIVLHNHWTLWLGGTEVYTRDFSRALAAQGCEVSVLYPVDRSVPEPRLVERELDGLQTFEVEHDASQAGVLETLVDPRIEPLFAQLLEREAFDLVHFQHTWLRLPLSLYRIARERVGRVCATLHDAWLICHQTHLLRAGDGRPCAGPDHDAVCARCMSDRLGLELDARRFSSLRELMALRHQTARAGLDACDVVTAPSHYLIERFRSAGIERTIEHAPLGVAPPPRLLAKPRDRVSFGFVGAITILKDPQLLLRAFREVRGDARLHFFGAGQPADELALRSAVSQEPRAIWRGAFPAERLGEVLSEIDVLVLPSRSENYPVVLREALAAGIPVIASSVGGVPEIVEPGMDGWLFPPGDPDALRDILQSIVDRPDLIVALRDRIRPVKTMQQDAAEWVERYDRLVPTSPRLNA